MAFAVNGVDNVKEPATSVATDDDRNSRRPSTTKDDSLPSKDVEYRAALEVLLLVMLGENARAVCADRRAQHESTTLVSIIVEVKFVQSDGFVPLVTP